MVESERPARARRGWAAFLALLAAVYFPMFAGKILFFRDLAHWVWPAQFVSAQARGNLELPQWNPLQGLGFSVLADPLYGPFYPPSLLFQLGSIPRLLTWFMFGHLVVGGMGLALLVKRLGAPAASARTAGILAALAWCLSGVLTSEWSAGMLLPASTFTPWTALGFVWLVDRALSGSIRPRHLVVASLPIAFALLLGEVFLAMMAVGMGVATAGLYFRDKHATQRADRKPESNRAFRSLVRAVASALFLAVLVGAITWWPARAAAVNTERSAGLAREQAEVWSVHPYRLLEFLAPGSMGDPYTVYPAGAIVGEPSYNNLPLFFGVYLGGSVVALALSAFGKKRRMAIGLAALGGLALLLSMGKYTPVHAIFRTLVPPLAWMRSPEKYLMLVGFSVATLAGLGTMRTLQGDGRWRRSGVLAVLLLLVALVVPPLASDAWAPYLRKGALHGAAAALGIAVVQVLLNRGRRGAGVLLWAVVALDLVPAVWALQEFAPPTLASQVPPAARRILDEHARTPDHLAPPRMFRAYRLDSSVARFLWADSSAAGQARSLATLTDNTATSWGIATVPGYEAATPAPFRRLWAEIESHSLARLRLLAVRYVLAAVKDPDSHADDPPELEPLMDPLPGSRLFRVRNVLPRVFFVTTSTPLDDERASIAVKSDDVLSGRRVILSTPGIPGDRRPPQPLAPADPAAPATGRCSLDAFAANRLGATCESNAAGWAVFVEAWDPGWHVTVDGSPAPLLRANVALRAVAMQPGRHKIEMTFHAAGLAAGSLGSGIGLALIPILALWPPRRNRDRAKAQATPSQ
jgi:hypothetical protein